MDPRCREAGRSTLFQYVLGQSMIFNELGGFMRHGKKKIVFFAEMLVVMGQRR